MRYTHQRWPLQCLSLNARWLITWPTTLTLKIVPKISHLLWTDFVKYNFVLDWHVHWYVCTAVWYVHISFIIISWYRYVTVFGLPVIFSQILPYGLAPNILFFASYSSLSTEESGVVVTWNSRYWRLLFLNMKDMSAVTKYQNMHLILFFFNTPFLSSTTDDLLQISLSSLMFGDNIYVGYVLKVPPVSYFLYIK